MRTHSASTGKKLHLRSRWYDDENPMKEYYQKLWPDALCPMCKAHNQNIIDDTDHGRTCPHDTDREEIAKETWKRIHNIIKKEKPDADPNIIYPFALATESLRNKHTEAINTLRAKEPALVHALEREELGELPVWAGDVGLIPAGLTPTLRLLGIKNKTDVLADEIALTIHQGIATAYRRRWRRINKIKKQREVYKNTVMQ